MNRGRFALAVLLACGAAVAAGGGLALAYRLPDATPCVEVCGLDRWAAIGFGWVLLVSTIINAALVGGGFRRRGDPVPMADYGIVALTLAPLAAVVAGWAGAVALAWDALAAAAGALTIPLSITVCVLAVQRINPTTTR